MRIFTRLVHELIDSRSKSYTRQLLRRDIMIKELCLLLKFKALFGGDVIDFTKLVLDINLGLEMD